MQDGRQIIGTVGATKYKHKKHKEQKTLKERNFKFRKSYAEVIRVMDDKQAGRFIKAVSDYVFDGRAYDGNDTAIKSAFTLVKVSLDGR